MAIIVRDIYNDTCELLLENGGLQSGIVTDDDFLRFLRGVVTDFLEKTGIIKNTFEVDAEFSVRDGYQYPVALLKLDEVFWDSQYLIQGTAYDIDHGRGEWAYKIDEVEQWHEDRSPDRTFSIFPAPPAENTVLTLVGTQNAIIGALQEAGVPWSDEFSDEFGPAQGEAELGLDATISDIPTVFGFYILAGVMAKIHSMDGEAKDDFKAMYFAARYQEGVSVAGQIMGEAVSG